ncbi:Beta-D-xylosidase 1 [Castilleja foliolosa]|uniref:Beta-D-xylosidase 1 n=1 Tax=Castilleja foliolosa TaxID=1961234 RepID=A0ABD3CB68_9LAMI
MGHKSYFIISLLVLTLFPFACESQRPLFACDRTNCVTRNLAFCNVSLSISDRVKDLIERLTLPEKIRSMVNNAAPIVGLGINGYEWWSEALHGVSNTGPGVKFGGDIPGATSFPQVITTAASFNASLWEAIGQVVSDEARAMYNGGMAGLTYWSPNVNIFRDPRWGRGQETPGEDPFLAAQYAIKYVRGLQGNAGRDNKLKVAACCKHYTAYDLDSWNGTDRFHFNAKVSKQDLEETYNVPFKACVSKGKVASVMCSYNQVNGKPTCADPSLLRDTIRGLWRLNGYIVSDCDSVDVFFKKQHYTTTPEDAAATTIKAGLDLDCGPFLAIHTEGAIRAGKLNETDVDQALTNLVSVQMRLGMFDGLKQPYLNLGPKNVCTQAHQQLALEAAQQGIVLLQNRNKTIPLSTSRHHTIAVIGPNANATNTMIGNYAGVPCGYTSPLQGISRYVETIYYEIGCASVTCVDNKRFRSAEKAASKTDVTVLVMGLSQAIEREGLDRVDLLLPGYQQELVSRVAKASRGPLILVLMSGGPIDITFAKNDPKITTILWAGYPGQAGGTAIADVLFGTTNPGGKLPMTWYPQNYLANVPMTDMRLRAINDYPGRTYKFYKGEVVYPFGHGLSYNSFRYNLIHGPTKLLIPFTNLKVSKNTTQINKGIRVSHTSCQTLTLRMHIDVENVGGMDGPHTVMVFASAPSIIESGSEKKLIAFEKIHVPVGGEERVKIKINPCDHLSVVDRFGIRRIPMGEHNLHFNEDLKHTITLYHDSRDIKP